MDKGELDNTWKQYKLDQESDRKKRRSDIERLREVRNRASLAGEVATSITDAIGFAPDMPYATRSDARISNPIPLGKMNEAEQDSPHAFAKVVVHYDFDRIEKVQRSRFGFKRVEIERVKSDRVSMVGLYYFAGGADATELNYFASSVWSIPEAASEPAITVVEEGLAAVITHLPDPQIASRDEVL
jgi:hypothetical protein